MKKVPAIVTGTIGADAHTVGGWIMSQALRREGFKVVYLGAVVPQREFIEAAVESDADAIFISSLYGMARIDCEGMRDKCIESGLKDILLYVGGILITVPEEWGETKKVLEDVGFDRVYPPETRPKTVIEDLRKDLQLKGVSV